MADESLLSDDLLRQLVAVGHVDILVGIPTLNNATTVVDVVRAAQAGIGSYFPRARSAHLQRRQRFRRRHARRWSATRPPTTPAP